LFLLLIDSYKGWVRDLTQEGIESNPEPISWANFETAVKKYYGSDWTQQHIDALSNLLSDIKGANGLTIEPVELSHVKTYLAQNAHRMKKAFDAVIEQLELEAIQPQTTGTPQL